MQALVLVDVARHLDVQQLEVAIDRQLHFGAGDDDLGDAAREQVQRAAGLLGPGRRENPVELHARAVEAALDRELGERDAVDLDVGVDEQADAEGVDLDADDGADRAALDERVGHVGSNGPVGTV